MDLTKPFIGSANATIDDKGRLKIPAAFRRILDDRYGPECFVTSIEGNKVIVYPMAIWLEFLEKFSRMPSLSLAQQKVLERLNYFGLESAMDGQGRILIPSKLRTRAGIADEVVVIGNTNTLVVWSEERFQKRLEENPVTSDDYKELELHNI